MKSIEQLRAENPALAEFSDEEMRELRSDLYTLARLILEWSIEQEPGSKAIPLGLLMQSSGVVYDTAEE
jgi:hypothetical protein